MLENNIFIYSHHLDELGSLYKEIEDIIKKNDVKINRISQNCFSISKDEKYLTVFPDGRLEFFASVCRDWEKLYILDHECQKFINRAIKDHEFHLMNSDVEKVIHENKLNIRLGVNLLTPSFFPIGKFIENNNYFEYKNLWSNNRFSKFNPLIYFCIYGGDEYYKCLKIAIESLILFGDYKGDILIKTDNIEKCKLYFSQFNNKFIYSLVNKDLGIFNRYIINEEVFKNYTNLIYLDSDILTINNVYPLLSRIAKRGDISLYSEFLGAEKENRVKNSSPWFGLDFVNNTPISTKTVYNSGFFCINNYEKILPIFEKVICYKFLEKKYGDQPFFNIALYDSELAIFSLEKNDGLSFARSNYELYDNLEKTFIHYNSGVGNLSKLVLMEHGYSFILKK